MTARTLIAAAGLVAGLVAAPSAGASVEAHAHAPGVAHQASRVTVTVKFTNCDNCGVQMNKGWNRGRKEWHSRHKTAQNGVVTFHVSAVHTRGSIFLVDAPWADLYGYQPLIATRYKSFRTGSRVTQDQAKHATEGTACWAGTHGRDKTLEVMTGRFKGRTPPGRKATGIRAWVLPTQDKAGAYGSTDHGAVGTQDVILCKWAHQH